MSDFGKILDDWIERHPPPDKDDDEEVVQPPDRPQRVAVDDTIDLHGLRLEEALTATERFVEESVARGHRKIVIIHGKGENGQGVLRREVRSLLERHVATGAMGYQKGVDGGRGASWVMLRSKGKGAEGLT
jgi:DNA-nicking Smr family endonuclease